MIEQWLRQDIERGFANNATRIVITDAKSEGAFMRQYIPSEYPVIEADGDQAEADAKYRAEHEFKDSKVVFYTHTPKRSLGLLLDYAKTGDCIVLDDMEAYIKNHIFHDLRLNVTMPRKQLILAAKLSFGKDKAWWTGICDGSIPPMDIHREVLNLILDPQAVYERMDPDMWALFQEEVFILLHKPLTQQSPITFALEILNTIFTGLVHNRLSKELTAIYLDLVNNNQYMPSMYNAIDQFDLSSVDVRRVHPKHCFKTLDRQLLRDLSKAIKENKPIFDYQHLLNNRLASNDAKMYRALWLNDLKTLLDFPAPDNIPDDIKLFVNYYQNNFVRLDTAMRHLYAEWLNEEPVLRPLQERYESINQILQEKWNAFFRTYTPDEYNLVPAFFREPGRAAVIVCDGLRLEMAMEVVRFARTYIKHAIVEPTTALAVLPSITENGMSALYGSHEVLPTAQKRFDLLHSLVPDIEIKPWDRFSRSETSEHLVLTFGDIDQVCEKKQLAGLKDIDHYPAELHDIVRDLLSIGYSRVLLTSDHGFVITGILDDADKIAKPTVSDAKIEERFALTNETFSTKKYHILPKPYGGYANQIYPKSDKPFVTRGAYGYAHGGFTPQECIIPAIVFSNPQAAPALKIRIQEKSQLRAVVGSFFKVRIAAEGDAGSLFEQERKVMISLYNAEDKATFQIVKTLHAGDQEEFELAYPGSNCKLLVVDAMTGLQLDSCEIKQLNQRDIDDL